jgi:coenzyme PQQ precursor peptide PqqA
MMTWDAPSFVEIDMSAEIGSYQEDFGGEEDFFNGI